MIEPYQPPSVGDGVELDLSHNEGRPVEPELLGRIAAGAGMANRYPDSSQLRAGIARLREMPADQVLVTAGADDALFRCCAALIGPGTHTVTTTPTFEMVARYAGLYQPDLIEVPWKRGAFPVEELTAAAAAGSVCIIVSPNNPTGEVITVNELSALAGTFEYVVLDGAYTEFADADLTATALAHPNVLMIRTLSKAWGLAGLRVGYLLGGEDLVREISAYGNPYPVSRFSLAVAAERIRSNLGVDAYIERVKTERDLLAALLHRHGYDPIPSQANFVYFDADDPQQIVADLAAVGIAVRAFPGRPGLEGAIRITVPGDPGDYQRLARALAPTLATTGQELKR